MQIEDFQVFCNKILIESAKEEIITFPPLSGRRRSSRGECVIKEFSFSPLVWFTAVVKTIFTRISSSCWLVTMPFPFDTSFRSNLIAKGGSLRSLIPSILHTAPDHRVSKVWTVSQARQGRGKRRESFPGSAWSTIWCTSREIWCWPMNSMRLPIVWNVLNEQNIPWICLWRERLMQLHHALHHQRREGVRIPVNYDKEWKRTAA